MRSAMIGEKIDNINYILSLTDKSLIGPICEFGVFCGHSLSTIGQYVIANNMTNLIYGFDSFEGLPYSDHAWKKGDFSCGLDECEQNLKNICGDNWNQYIKLVKGWYSDTLTSELFNSINNGYSPLIHIDCDLYQSALEALSFIQPLMTKNTYIMFDEFDFGEDRAWSLVASKRNINYERVSHVELQVTIKII